MVRLNNTRVNYLERLQRRVNDSNSASDGAGDIDLFFERLVQFAQDLNTEEQRTVTKQLSEEELGVFDLLTRPGPRLSQEEREQAKTIARE